MMDTAPELQPLLALLRGATARRARRLVSINTGPWVIKLAPFARAPVASLVVYRLGGKRLRFCCGFDDNVFDWHPEVSPADREEIHTRLVSIATDPSRALALQGHQSRHCSGCGWPLTHVSSTDMALFNLGYCHGCALVFGLSVRPLAEHRSDPFEQVRRQARKPGPWRHRSAREEQRAQRAYRALATNDPTNDPASGVSVADDPYHDIEARIVARQADWLAKHT